MSARIRLSTTRRVKVFEDARGLCHICEQKIFGKEWEVEHVIPLALGGADDESNMRPAHTACHAGKTRDDNASWTKAKRVRAKHIGAHRKRTYWPCGKGTKWKMKVDRTVVPR